MRQISDDDRRQWEDDANWLLPIGFYFAKKDSRWLVPRRRFRGVCMGWTFNLGHPVGAWAMLIVMLLPTLLMAAVICTMALLHAMGQVPPPR